MGNPAGGAPVSDPLSELEQSIVDNVAKHGCFIMSVFDPEGLEPEFSYSIGFEETTGQNEVIVFSLPKNLRASMINEIWRQMSERGLRLSDGTEIFDLLEGYRCIARQVTSQEAIRENFGSAIWYNRRFGEREITLAYQIVWPGARQGLFPWDNGCVQEVIDDQPALYEMGVVQ